jgi:hypothetical protein
MDPRLKDGVRAHPSVFVAGILFHCGIAAWLTTVVLALAARTVPSWLQVLLIAVNATGVVSGVTLLVRRLQEPVLQAISVADDYVSNLLVVAALLASTAFLLVPRLNGWLLLATAALVVYAPFGKIRHCVLFFVTRTRFGAFIGARGVLVGRSRR